MKHRTTLIRLGALAALGALVLTACGGAAPVTIRPSDQAPAGHLLTAAQARALPEPTFTPTPTATSSVPGVVAPSAAAEERVQGPPGNPSATTFADPPAVGRYPHRIVVTGGFGRQELSFEVDMREPTSAAGGRRQLQVWDVPEFPQEFQYLWKADRLLLERIKTTNPDGSEQECQLDPPAISLRLPMAIGESWDDEYSCGEAQTESSSEVIRTERVKIGDAEVDTFVVRTKSTTDARGDTSRETTTAWYAPEQRLFVIVESQSKGSFGTYDVTIEALSVSPSGG